MPPTVVARREVRLLGWADYLAGERRWVNHERLPGEELTVYVDEALGSHVPASHRPYPRTDRWEHISPPVVTGGWGYGRYTWLMHYFDLGATTCLCHRVWVGSARRDQVTPDWLVDDRTKARTCLQAKEGRERRAERRTRGRVDTPT